MPISLLFSGHMTDLPGRWEPRFPASLEKAVEKRIAATVSRYVGVAGVAGFASAARGADIIFHEQCRAIGIPTTIVIPFSPAVFVEQSIARVPDQTWEFRFWKLWDETDIDRRDAMMLRISPSAYRACNVRLVSSAAAHGDVHLVAFWDGQKGDGPGGTGNLVELVKTPARLDVFTPEDVARICDP